jgi:small-conductance mechanosensitive channel
MPFPRYDPAPAFTSRPPGWDWLTELGVAGQLVAAAVVGVAVYLLFSFLAYRTLRRPRLRQFHAVLIRWLRPPARVAFPLLFLLIARARQLRHMGTAPVGGPKHPWSLDHLLQLAVIAVLSWIAVSLIGATADFFQLRHPIDRPDNQQARRVHTQVTVIGRSLQVLAMLVGLGVALLTFPRVRELGTSLLFSAGIAGIVVGLAARPVLENLIAGVQIGLTQPIRIDDVVIVEGEWGKVQEITLTYVVVRIWDQRTLIVPFSKFLADPFQNWTRTSSDVWGTLFLWVDYTAPVDRIRDAARRIVTTHPLWDGRVFALQVTEVTERAAQLRVLVSAADAGKAFDLRCEVRERLLAFLARELPASLPRLRHNEPPPSPDDLP